jgi:hypothetical protein
MGLIYIIIVILVIGLIAMFFSYLSSYEKLMKKQIELLKQINDGAENNR